jgi:hypothetical protein
MTDRPDGAFDACMQFAAEQARIWVPRWLSDLSAALQQQESLARSFIEKQTCGHARMVLGTYREQVSERFLIEISSLTRNAEMGADPMDGPSKVKKLSLDDLELVEHGQVHEKVSLSRVQQMVKVAVDESIAPLNALLSRARGLNVVRNDVNPLLPGPIVAALSSVLGTLHLDEGVRSLWMQTGAVPLGSELKHLYAEMGNLLVQRGVSPAGYLVVQRPANSASSAFAKAGGRDQKESDNLSMMAEQGGDPQLTLDHLHALLKANTSGSEAGNESAQGSAGGLAYPLAAEVVTLMLRKVDEGPRLLKPLRDLIQGLQPGLMQLARNDPSFFADPANAARLLLDAITLQGTVFRSEQDAGYAEFAARTRRVVVALQSDDAEFAARLRASLRRFDPAAETPANRSAKKPIGGFTGASSKPGVSPDAVASCGTAIRDSGLEEAPPEFSDTVPMNREFVLVALQASASNRR